ncbi:UPF0183 protein C16orf70-like protein [Elysia marginata]|uniref:UPF0183 protein C16orf70-like protein n=1 Tax=Elysia marginata TaxID=1093978 RepID=A0AAV4J4Q2_9GAST|nr:UPF0183 protein C16orf70-like protein [Elysia marginata]
MLDLEVTPERSLGNEQWEFVLGMPFYQAVNILKRQDSCIKGVQVWYSEASPLTLDLVLYLSQDGIKLIFDPVSQRLKIIEVNAMHKVKLKYCGVPFNTPQVKPTIEQVDQSFGATHPGVYIAEKQLFVLNFRGLSFDFQINSTYENLEFFSLFPRPDPRLIGPLPLPRPPHPLHDQQQQHLPLPLQPMPPTSLPSNFSKIVIHSDTNDDMLLSEPYETLDFVSADKMMDHELLTSDELYDFVEISDKTGVFALYNDDIPNSMSASTFHPLTNVTHLDPVACDTPLDDVTHDLHLDDASHDTRMDHATHDTQLNHVHTEQPQLSSSTSSSTSSSLSLSPPHQPKYAHGLGSLQFPNGMSPVVARMCIYSGNSLTDARAPSLPVACFYGNCFLECLEVLRENNITQGIKFLLVTEGNVQGKLVDTRKKSVERIVRFGDSVQDVVSALGCPSRQFFKSEDKMKIHLPDAHKHVRAESADYFFNYFTMGVDILFDAVTHTVKKFVLHTNYPGEYNFNIYCRCVFKLPIVVEPDRVIQPQTIIMEDDLLVITAYSKWDEVQKVLMTPKQRPVILNRSASTNTSNPFGSTFCYGVQDLIFEVMANQHIASVTLYQSSHGQQAATLTS